MTAAAAHHEPTVQAAVRAACRLDRSSPIPLWLQLKNGLADAIRGGSLGDDERLPSEHALCFMFKVSRTVIRAALHALAAEGRVTSIARRGVFVARPREDLDFAASNVGLFGEMTAKGHIVTTRTFELRRVPAAGREAQMLRLPPGADMVRVGRVYDVDGKPLAVGRITLPGHKVPGFETLALEDRSVYATLRERYGLEVARSERWFEAVTPTAEQARLLRIAASVPLVAIESVGLAGDGTPIEYYRSLYNTRRNRIHLVVATSAEPAGAVMMTGGRDG